jgi:N-hydroxyarylamine O-acetyltransferase
MRPLPADQLAAYLARLDVPAPTRADLPALARLQLAHLERIPFENLDIHAGRAISIDDDDVYTKVVERRRGGYCYELNSLLARLLTTLRYRPSLVSARVARPDGFGAEYDHLALLVGIGGTGDSGRWLVDVGFGDAFTAPIPFADGAAQADRDRDVRLTAHGDDWWYEEDDGSGWAPKYAFTARPRDLAAFADRNRWQQSSPDSHFVTGPLCSRLTPTGRITLSGDRLITTDAGRRSERALGEDEARAVLREEFGIEWPARPSLDAIDPGILANPTAILATNGPDGRPQVTPLSYLVEDGRLCLSVTESTPTVENLRRDGRCSVTVTHPDSPGHHVEIRGFAAIEPDHHHALADRLRARRGGDLQPSDELDARRVRIAIRPLRVLADDRSQRSPGVR